MITVDIINELLQHYGHPDKRLWNTIASSLTEAQYWGMRREIKSCLQSFFQQQGLNSPRLQYEVKKNIQNIDNRINGIVKNEYIPDVEVAIQMNYQEH